VGHAPLDIARARRDTPGCERVLHFNNAGAALMPRQVLDAMTAHLRLEAQIGGYEAAEQEHEATERVYAAAARLMGCSTDEIAVVENATRAWDMAFYAIPFAPGDRILTCMSEYCSNYIAFLQVAGRTGARVEVVPSDGHGQLDVAALRAMLDERVRLVAVNHVPTNGGLVNPAEEIGRAAREAGVIFLLDSAQSLGQLPTDVRKIGCDILASTGRKFLRGPRGTGLLYVRRDLIEKLEPPFLDIHAARWGARDRYEIRGDARRFENWETNYAAKIGLGVAVEYAIGWGMDAVWERVSGLAATLRERLGEIPGVTVRDLGAVKCGIVTFTVEGRDPREIRRRLGAQGANVTASLAEYARLDMEQRRLAGVVRASVHYYNTEEEVERFCRLVATMA